MATALTAKGRQLANKVLIFQCLVAGLMVAVFAITLGSDAAVSATSGAMACLVPCFIFARLVFRYAGASYNQLVVRSFNQGSKLKLILTVIIFVLAFSWLHAQPLPLFGTFAGTTIAQWLAMFYLRNQS